MTIDNKNNIKWALIALLTFPTLVNAQDMESIKADCYMEGEGEGLEGIDLDEYADSCAEELSGLTLIKTS
ncbi:MAG: hypothetical protein RPU64_10625 [Candidatus Sedimenticola sp. (ex Thyasira tokunagai)]